MKIQLLAALLALPCVALAQTPSSTEPSATNAAAQPPPPPEGNRPPPDPAARLDHLTKELSLTPEQQEKVKPLLQDEFTQAKAIHEDASLDAAAKHQKMEDLHKDTIEKLGAILTAEQLDKLKAMHHHHGPPRQHLPRPKRRSVLKKPSHFRVRRLFRARP